MSKSEEHSKELIDALAILDDIASDMDNAFHLISWAIEKYAKLKDRCIYNPHSSPYFDARAYCLNKQLDEQERRLMSIKGELFNCRIK